MSKYLILWEVDRTRVPTDLKERGSAWLAMMDMVKEDIKAGGTTDWGVIPGELKGYSIAEGTEVDIMSTTILYAPYIKFEIHPVASLDQAEEAVRASMK